MAKKFSPSFTLSLSHNHRSQMTVTNMIIKFEILWELPERDPETHCKQVLLEKNDLFNVGLPQTSHS